MESLRQEQLVLHFKIQSLSRQINQVSLEPRFPPYLLDMYRKERNQLCFRYKQIYKIITHRTDGEGLLPISKI